MKRVVVVLGVLVVGGLAWWIWWRAQVPKPTQAPEQQVETTFPPQSEPSSTNLSNNNAVPSAAPSENVESQVPVQDTKPVRELAPTRDAVRKQVAANPHVTPPALIQFGVELYKRREQALKSEPEARKFFQELEACVGNKDSAYNAQGVCLVNAHYTKEKYPSLSGQFDQLEKSATPEARKFLSGVLSSKKH
jgi:hypothetical protein